jgi:hypothetical protein
MEHQKVPPCLQMIYLGGKDTLIQTLSASSVRVQEFFKIKLPAVVNLSETSAPLTQKVCQVTNSVQQLQSVSLATASKHQQLSQQLSAGVKAIKTFFYFFTDILDK